MLKIEALASLGLWGSGPRIARKTPDLSAEKQPLQNDRVQIAEPRTGGKAIEGRGLNQ
jgi:hypothetical protein